MSSAKLLSIILPAYNEAGVVGNVVKSLREAFPDAEILVVNDCSRDSTAEEAGMAGARVVSHQYNMGNGAAIKTGARQAAGDILVFMDADGQHSAENVRALLDKLDAGYDMAIGARDAGSQANRRRHVGNSLLNRLASLLTGHKIHDLTSGFRAAKANVFRQFLYLLPNGFSYPTTSTMAFLRSGYSVAFVPIKVRRRQGSSKISFLRDGIRFLVIIMKMTTLFSPMRVFFPLSMLFFILGTIRYIYFYWQTGGFSNMAGIMFMMSMLIFLIGLVSEQITALHYGMSHSDCTREED
ncbi:glycosyltransferase family 2 protein [Thiolapillus brandeum]|uniref:Glycosyl transferase family 2 n=1 Tax=Thiolapillus brandeum TaxID=1076588 RepID=A0A7U6JH74_9GAMM|nr:glycosyltransferase family 2 protein [Thiolapillus brandeum]BAO43522.1 glycosyl transferase family 2 [Thiolapillus brandeum]